MWCRKRIPRSIELNVQPGELDVGILSAQELDLDIGVSARRSKFQHVVQNVHAESPLLGQVCLGMRLIAIDGKDVRKQESVVGEMSANTPRKLEFQAAPLPNGTTEGTLCVIGIVSFIAIFLNYVWYRHLWPHHLEPILGARAAGVLTSLWTIDMGLAMLNYWKCIYTEPGYTAEGDDLLPPAGLPEDCEGGGRATTPTSGKAFCTRCSWAKPARAHHCSVCKRCVRRMDHHCMFLVRRHALPPAV